MRRGDTLLFEQPPVVGAWAAAGGKKESEGPLASAFDFLTQDAGFAEQGCENWEQAESLLQRRAVELCLRIGGEVVSADSMQIYRGMDVLSAMPTAAEMPWPSEPVDMSTPGVSFMLG